MIERAELLKKIENLSPDYYNEVFGYVEHLRKKALNENTDRINAYKEMAADFEREQEAREWCSAYFGTTPSK